MMLSCQHWSAARISTSRPLSDPADRWASLDLGPEYGPPRVTTVQGTAPWEGHVHYATGGAPHVFGDAHVVIGGAHASVTTGNYGLAIGGAFSTALAGFRGHAICGPYGRAMTGDYGFSRAGHSGTAWSGKYGRAICGPMGHAMSEWGSAECGEGGTAEITNTGFVRGGVESSLVLGCTGSKKVYTWRVDGKKILPGEYYYLEEGKEPLPYTAEAVEDVMREARLAQLREMSVWYESRA